MPETRRPMTTEELSELPDDGLRHELVEGELHSMTPAGFEHGDVAGELFFHVKAYVREQALDVFEGEDVLPGFRLPLRELFRQD